MVSEEKHIASCGYSPFALAFLTQLKVPGLDVRRLFDNVRDDVIENTRRRQQPFAYGSLPGRDFILVSPGGAGSAAPFVTAR